MMNEPQFAGGSRSPEPVNPSTPGTRLPGGDSLPRGARPLLQKPVDQEHNSPAGKRCPNLVRGRNDGWVHMGHCDRCHVSELSDGIGRVQTREEWMIDLALSQDHNARKEPVRVALNRWADTHTKPGDTDNRVLRYLIHCTGWKPTESDWLQSYPKQQTIANDLGVSIDTVKRSIRRLKARGLIGSRATYWSRYKRRGTAYTLYAGGVLQRTPVENVQSENLRGLPCYSLRGLPPKDPKPLKATKKPLPRHVKQSNDARASRKSDERIRASSNGRDRMALPVDAMSTAHVALQGTVSALQTSADTPGGATWREYDEILSREIAETRANKPAYKPVDWHRYPLLSRDWARPAEWKAGRLLQGRDLDSRFYDARAECLAILNEVKCYDHVSLLRSLINPLAVLEVLQRGRWRDSNQWGVSCRREIADMPAILFQIDAPGAVYDYAAGQTDFAGMVADLATAFAAA